MMQTGERVNRFVTFFNTSKKLCLKFMFQFTRITLWLSNSKISYKLRNFDPYLKIQSFSGLLMFSFQLKFQKSLLSLSWITLNQVFLLVCYSCEKTDKNHHSKKITFKRGNGANKQSPQFAPRRPTYFG